MLRRPAIVNFHDPLRHDGQPPDCQKLKIEHGLLILHEACIEPTAGALVAGIAGGHREAARKGRLRPGGLRPDRLGDRSVQAAAALLQILAGPFLRKGDGKADAVRLDIRSRAAIDDAIHAAARRQHGS